MSDRDGGHGPAILARDDGGDIEACPGLRARDDKDRESSGQWRHDSGFAVGASAAVLSAVARRSRRSTRSGPGDKLRIEVVGRPEMTDTFEVDAEGMINYWEVGRVKASGYTPQSLAGKLTTLLVEGRFMRRPQVRVSRRGVRQPEGVRGRRGAAAGLLRAEGGPFASGLHERDRASRRGRARGDRDSAGDRAPRPTTAVDAGGSGARRRGGGARSCPGRSRRERLRRLDEAEERTSSRSERAPIEIPGLPPIDPSNEVIRVNMLELQVGGAARTSCCSRGTRSLSRGPRRCT